MTNPELLQLDPQHLAELADCYTAFEFDDVEIVAHEVSPAVNEEPWSVGYAHINKKLVFAGLERGDKHMHALFCIAGDDNNFYYHSYARHGAIEDRIIFKLIRHV